MVVVWLQIFVQLVSVRAELVPDKSETIREILAQVVVEGKAPGMVAAIISADGVIASGAAGSRKAGNDQMMTTSDSVYLGSCTKAMTCAMIAILVGDGQLVWDMTLIEAIPELKQEIRQEYHDLSLWQLLTHRAGVEDCWTFDTGLTKEKRLALVKKKLSAAPVHKQGEFHYSNLGYVAAACMAENVTGLLWETLMTERLFLPLGMTSVGFGFPGTRGQIDQPWGHEKIGNGWHPSQVDCSPALGPAGTVHCAIADWAAFLSLFLTSQNPLLDPFLMARLVEPTGYYAGGWGVSTDQPWANGKMLSHNGSNGTWYSSVVVAPELDRVYVVVTNSRDFGVTKGVCSGVITSLVRADSKWEAEVDGAADGFTSTKRLTH